MCMQFNDGVFAFLFCEFVGLYHICDHFPLLSIKLKHTDVAICGKHVLQLI